MWSPLKAGTRLGPLPAWRQLFNLLIHLLIQYKVIIVSKQKGDCWGAA